MARAVGWRTFRFEDEDDDEDEDDWGAQWTWLICYLLFALGAA